MVFLYEFIVDRFIPESIGVHFLNHIRSIQFGEEVVAHVFRHLKSMTGLLEISFYIQI